MFTRYRHLVLLLCLFSPLGLAQDFDWAPQLPVGSTVPALEAPDQHGQVQTLASLTGEEGLVIFFNRSFDWCPYCIAQLKDLAARQADFEALGYNLMAITYDPVATLAEAAEDYSVDFALLHDENAKHVNAFGILNMDYKPGDAAYGIPLPGIFVLDAQGVVQAKFAEENYRERPDLGFVIDTIEGL